MIIDFHTHSNASDGSLSAEELVAQAIAAGVDCLAITDHDCIDGYLAVRDKRNAWPEGFSLRSGVELSCRWANDTVHIVGLDIDVASAELLAGLEFLSESRNKRAEIIAQRLEKIGFNGALSGALEKAGASQIGRPHFAAWMIACGHVTDAKEAFDKYLGAGQLGDVKAYWPRLSQVVEWITVAGGVAILAHPLKYKYTRSKLRRLIEAFRSAGGTSLEIFSGRQPEDRTLQLRRLAAEFDLLASAGSDFHGYRDYGPRLGVNTVQFGTAPSLWSGL